MPTMRHALALAAFSAPSLSLALLLSLLSCRREGPVVTAPVELVTSASPDAALVATLPKPTSTVGRCELTLSAGSIRTGTSCVLDEQISAGRGTLHVPCNGDGPASATFGKHHFEGSVTNGRVDLTLTTELDWDDGCHWTTQQTLTGSTRTKVLRWGYQERPLSGSSCFGSCVATAEVIVTAHGAPRGPSTSGPDEDEPDDAP